VRNATEPGLIAPQPGAGIGSYIPGDPLEQGEDCLTCNIFSAPSAKEARPVVLFVHGGTWRSGNKNLYGALGQSLAADGIGCASALSCLSGSCSNQGAQPGVCVPLACEL